MDRPTALALLGAQCAATVYPLLDSTALGLLLDATAAWTIWLPSTTYVPGDQVLPTVRNGHVYRAIVNQLYGTIGAPGISGAVEPIWPLYTNPDSRTGLTRPYWDGYSGGGRNYTVAMVADNTVIWQEAGPDSDNQWDLRLATYNGWIQKAGLASADYAVGIDRDKFSRDQVIAHCLLMAQRYQPTGIF